MTAPDLLDRHGPTLHVTASASKPVFVGIGQDLDVASYLSASEYSRVVRFDVPAKFDTQEMKGGQTPLSPPAGLDWWKVKAAGPGNQTVAWEIADGRYDVVVMNADGSPGVAARITFGVELAGAFRTCLLVLGIGVVLVVVGLVLILFRRRRQPGPLVPVVAAAPVMPYNPPTYEKQGHVRRCAGLATGVVLMLAATGCVAVPEKNTSQSLSRPTVTLADGQLVGAGGS
jgi:hypothetical protein